MVCCKLLKTPIWLYIRTCYIDIRSVKSPNESILQGLNNTIPRALIPKRETIKKTVQKLSIQSAFHQSLQTMQDI